MIYLPANNKIACVPPTSTQLKVTVKSGFARVDQKVELIALTVKHGNCYLANPIHPEVAFPPKVFGQVGDILYVSGESIKHQWLNQVYDLGEGPFVLVPEEVVLMVGCKENKEIIKEGQN